MITSDNLTSVLDNLNGKDIDMAMDLGSFVLELCVFNSGGVSRVRDLEEDETEDDVRANGNLYIDFDELLQLFNESGSLNPWLLEIQAEEDLF